MSFARAVLSELTWRKLAIMLAVAFSLPVLTLILAGTAMSRPQSICLGISAFCNLLLMLAADEAASRGAHLRHVNLMAVFGILVVNGTIGAIGVRFGLSTIASAEHWGALGLAYGINQSLWAIFALFVYQNRRIAQRMLQAVRKAELRRVRLEAQLVESRLAATRAQVDPQMLFAALAEARGKLSSNAPDANAQLDELIQRLRAALARTVVSSDFEVREP